MGRTSHPCALSKCLALTANSMLRLLTGRLDLTTGPFFMRLYQDSGETAEDQPKSRIERGKALLDRDDPASVSLIDNVGLRLGATYALRG